MNWRIFQFWNWFKKEKPYDGPKIGDTFKVNDPDEARLVIATASARCGKILFGDVDWNEDGTGIVTITGVSNLPEA